MDSSMYYEPDGEYSMDYYGDDETPSVTEAAQQTKEMDDYFYPMTNSIETTPSHLHDDQINLHVALDQPIVEDKTGEKCKMAFPS